MKHIKDREILFTLGFKKCSKCNIEKRLSEFSKDCHQKHGYNTSCKECIKKRNMEYKKKNKNKLKIWNKKYRENNKKAIKKYAKVYREENKEKISKYSSKYLSKHGETYSKKYYRKNKKANIAKTTAWKKANPEKMAANRRRYKKKYKLRNKMSKSIAKALKTRGSSKQGQKTWGQILKYTVDDLKAHLESLFEPGMNWDNYGAGPNKWCLDHVIPDSHFKYNSIDDDGFKKSWALNNLQPMWFIQNSSKGNRYSGVYDSSK